MANLILIMGKSGSGKSTSIKTLNPQETVIINVLSKRLPFKGSNKIYNKENKNLFNISDYSKIKAYLTSISNNAKHVKTVIIDDCTYLMRKELFAKATDKGYNKFSEIAKNFQDLVQTIESLRDELNVVLMMHVEEEVHENGLDSYKCATVGKMIEDKYKPEELVTTTLICDIKIDKDTITHGFYTRAAVYNNKLIPARSPEGMFDEDETFIPNDLQFVVDKVNEFYN